MDLIITPMEFGNRQQPVSPDNRIFEFLGEEGMRKMVSDHYDIMSKSTIKELFPANVEGLEMAKKHSADFFIQRFGGPNYYDQHRGSPQLVRRHAPFKISPEERIVWLECYREVILKLEIPEDVKLEFWNFLDIFSNWMVNTPQRDKSTNSHFITVVKH